MKVQHKMFLIGVLLMVLPFIGFSQQKTFTGWTAVYSHDELGKPTTGNIQTLLDGLRKGYALKIGWSWERTIADSLAALEHFAEPIFTTIIQKKNVSAVIHAHPLLLSYIDINNQKFSDPDQLWQCVLTTRGTFNAMVYSRSSGKLIKDWPQKHKMTWYLHYP